MMWLRSNECYDRLAELDPSSGRYTVLDRKDLGEMAPSKCDGVFSVLNHVFVAIYPIGNQVIFRLGDEVFELDDRTIVDVEGPNDSRLLRVIHGGHPIATHVYAITAKRFEDDPTPMIDDEDFDFGLLVENISKHPERKEVMLGKR